MKGVRGSLSRVPGLAGRAFTYRSPAGARPSWQRSEDGRPERSIGPAGVRVTSAPPLESWQDHRPDGQSRRVYSGIIVMEVCLLAANRTALHSSGSVRTSGPCGGMPHDSQGADDDQGRLVEARRSELWRDGLTFRALIEHAPLSIWACNDGGTLTFANRPAIDLFGIRDPREVVGCCDIYRDTTEAEKPLPKYFERAWAGEVVHYRQTVDMATVKCSIARHGTLDFHTTLLPVPRFCSGFLER